MLNRPTVVITHHTGGTNQDPSADTSNHTVRTINEWHKRLWPEFISRKGWHVGYHYFIDKDGELTQTRYHDEEGAHCIGMNKRSIGVCFAGNFDVTLPTLKQEVAWARLYSQLQREYPGLQTHPHRKYATKSCHGRRLRDDYFTVEQQRLRFTEIVRQLIIKLISTITGKRMK